MSKNKLTTGSKPIKFAEALSKIVLNEWETESIYDNVSDVTAELLEYWFSQDTCDNRSINFHEGQKQAILNAIYCYEVLKCKNIFDVYSIIEDDVGEVFIDDEFLSAIKNDKYDTLKYCIKMATGTGKTFVMNALFIWQVLNALYNKDSDVNWIKNFLIIAPGVIVYDRLLDSFLGKEKDDGGRDFNTSDIKRNEDLFLPYEYRETLYSFVNNNLVEKDEIGKKITGSGLIAITNWQYLYDFDKDLLSKKEDEKEKIVCDDYSLKAMKNLVDNVLELPPSKNAGSDLNVLDSRYTIGDSIKYLSSLNNLCIINDEAHHIHDLKKDEDLVWEAIINLASKNKDKGFLQIDFSATPYNNVSNESDAKNYFPHIIVDFPLVKAIQQGLVKIVSIDERIQTASIQDGDLNFKAEGEKNNKYLSDGQRIMLRAGLAKLSTLEEQFSKLGKTPKMMVICEDTEITPLVEEFLQRDCGLNEKSILRVDSSKKGSISENEWNNLKIKLNNVDKNDEVKVIVSVLMLREGFDVNNICVVVPLRSSSSQILLEQTIGRGLRLMWRNDDVINEIKADNRHKLFIDKSKEFSAYYDILFIVEHPNYKKFYDKLIEEGVVVEEQEYSYKKALGDLIKVDLKENYEKYDLFWPVIVKDEVEELSVPQLTIDDIKPIQTKLNLEELKDYVKKHTGEIFRSREIITQTQFGTYRVNSETFTANSYNEYLTSLINNICKNVNIYSNNHLDKKKKSYPSMQINQAYLIAVIDNYIRHKLFEEEFNPFVDENWRILMLEKAEITTHLIKQLSEMIIKMQNNLEIEKMVIEKKYFSCLNQITMRENYSIEVSKCIYPKLGFPSNKGGFERDFIEACDRDSNVEAFLKIKERAFDFINLKYINERGFLARYYPDFIVKTKENVFIVETKGKDRMDNENTQNKLKSAYYFVEKINKFNPEDRDNRTWYYTLLSDQDFYNLIAKNTPIDDMLKLNRTKIYKQGELDV